MDRRNYIPPSALNRRQDPRPQIDSPPSRHNLIEDRIAANHREIQAILVDNQRLAATHVALKQEFTIAQQDLRHFSSVAGNIKAERDDQVRELYERAAKLEAEIRLINELSTELTQVRGDVQKLTSERKELVEKLDKVRSDVAKAQSKTHQVSLIKEEIEAMQKEIRRGRAAVEYEKKVHASNVEQSQTMEKYKVSMAQEIEKLQAELANADKRARAAAAAAAAAVTPGTGYAAVYGNPEMGYGGNAYPGPYAAHQVQGVDPQYGPGAVAYAPYDVQHPNLHG